MQDAVKDREMLTPQRNKVARSGGDSKRYPKCPAHQIPTDDEGRETCKYH